MMWFLSTAFAATPSITDAPAADRPPMIAGEAVCHATIAHDATGAVSGAEVAQCPELFAASTRMAAEKLKLSGVEKPGAISLLYAFSSDGDGLPKVAPTSMPVLGLPYELTVTERKAPKYPKKAQGTEPVTCLVELKVDAEGLATDVKTTECPEVFHAEVDSALKKWQWEPIPNPPEGGVPTKIQMVFTPK